MAEKEYIERDSIYGRVKTHTNPYGKPTLDYKSGVKVLDMIKQEPAADVVEVVRCEHCKHSWFNGVDLWLCHREAKSYCPTVKADAFCSYGERKETTP